MRRSITTLCLTVLVVLGACGSDSPSVSDGSAGSSTTEARAVFPVTVTGANGSVAIAARPTKIVSLSPTATEMLFAIGAGAQVSAVDDQSNYPAGVPTSKLSGFQPNVEAIVGAAPDLVVASNDPGSLVAGLGAAKVAVLLLPAAKTLDDTYGQIGQLGAATGHKAGADRLVKSMKVRMAKAVAAVGDKGKGLTYYHELDNTLYSATSKTFIGALYSSLGLVNIADQAPPGSDYPQLSAEFIVKADPDVVFLADTKCCKQSAATLKARPGFDKLKAVASGNVVELDDDIASRWGPRVVDLLEKVAAAVAKVEVAKAGG